jgi:hypothetical protein
MVVARDVGDLEAGAGTALLVSAGNPRGNAVGKSGRTFAGKAPDPLAHCLLAHSQARRHCSRPLTSAHPFDRFRSKISTIRCGAGILMHVRPG